MSPDSPRAVIRLVAMILISVLLPTTALAAAAGLGSRVLRQGMRGNDVRTLQNDLTQVGLHTPLTGFFNSATRRNVTRFERENGLAPTGRVGRRLLRILDRQLIAHSLTAVADTGSGGVNGGPAVRGVQVRARSIPRASCPHCLSSTRSRRSISISGSRFAVSPVTGSRLAVADF